jgi:hypothetical protein
MKPVPAAKVIALAILFGVFAQWARAQTKQQLAEVHSISEKDWTETLDYCDWLLNAQFWIEHPDSEYAKQFFAELNLSAADDVAFGGIVADFNKRHDQLMADSYAKLDSSEWTPETQTKLVLDLVDTTNDAIRRIETDLSAEGASKVDSRARI